MMRSLFSGVSGLKNHQTRMDVIGNNISNVNTTGFKSSRVNFTDMLSQTLTGASSPNGNVGGTNPKQIGLGSSVGSVDLIFTNGSVQSTGKNTDLCISGNGLFVVKDNSGTYYTRDGAFEFDAEGNYVLPGNGLFVQGWMANNGVLTTTGETTNIVVPAGKSMGSEATSTTTYCNNLNGDPEGYTISNIQVMYADGNEPSTDTIPTYIPTALEGSITIETSTGRTYTLDRNLVGLYALDDSLDGKDLYTSKITSVTANPSGPVSLTCSVSDTSKYVSVSPLSISNLTSGTYSVGGNYSKTQTITNAVADNVAKTITLTLDNTAGDGFTTVVIPQPKDSPMYHAGDSFTTTVRIDQVNASANAVLNLANGKTETLASALVVNKPQQDYTVKGTAADGTIKGLERNATDTVYTVNGREVSNIIVNTSNGQSLSGLVAQSYSANNTFYPSVVTTVTVYDSLGGSHDVPVLFTKTGENEWSLSLTGGGDTYSYIESDKTQTTVSLTSSKLTFKNTGVYEDGSATLKFTYGNGAADQEVSVNLGSLTQYIGSSTINADSNGHAAGTLSSVSIDTSGVITGTYTNGVKQAEAQVAIAQFNNASGLTKTGDSLYQESNNSGTANVKTASDLGVKITPSALEMSNVDVANEFTDMIITQRGFQGNSKIITVSDEMLETLINMKR